jgi:site-specific DNA recombinase
MLAGMPAHTENSRSAAIYVRISQDRGGAGLGVERQKDECHALAERLGWDVVEVYCDNDLSAFSGRRRPDYERMLTDIKAGAINAVISWHPDRLHRRALELERYISLCDKHGVENQTVTAGHWDLSTATGKMVARQIGNTAVYESEHKSERLKAARIQHAKQGKHHGGIRCYGYERDGVTVRPDEAAEIARACKAVAGGASLRAVVRDMNTRKVPTATGKVGGWTSQQLRQTLISPRIAGYSTHKGIVVGTAAWPAIVDDATFRTVESLLANPARRTNHGVTGAVKWLGSGLYICAVCGDRKLRAGVSGGAKQRTYRCANRDHDRTRRHVSRAQQPLDAFVEKLVVEWLARPGTVEKLLHRDDTADVAALRVEQVQIGARKDELAVLFADGQIDAVQFATATKRLDEKAVEIAGTLAKAGWRSPLEPLAGGDIRAAWAALSLMQKRAIVDAVVDVTVLPTKPTTRGFDKDGVAVEWKVG